jgi:beta-glucosidase
MLEIVLALAGAFPPDFTWGTATAAVQVEGQTVHSDWEAFERRPGAIRDGDRIGDAARHWELYEQDFAAAHQMGTNGYRCSIEWSRLEPTRGAWDEEAVTHYRAMFESLRAKGIKPLVTLHHFSNPQWVADQGGWESAQTQADFEAFVGRAADAFGDLVDDWVTINEPTVYACEGYVDGGFPPGRHGDFAAIPRVLGNLVKAHGRAYRVLHQRDPGCRVGIAEHMVAFAPAWSWSPFDGLMASTSENWMNYGFLDAATTGRVRFDTGVAHDWEDVPWLAGTVDFVGVNYYTRSLASLFSPFRRITATNVPTTDLGLEICPDGMFEVLSRTHARYKLPIFITETGAADEQRRITPGFMTQHLDRVRQAIGAGVPVKGVYWWSLMDNFEWQNGYHGRFGLLAVDFAKPERPRTWTKAAELYAQIVHANALPPSASP